MPVPPFQDFIFPLLDLLKDGQTYRSSDVNQRMADLFELDQEDRQELLNSGRQTRLENRVQWAATYLRKAGLIQNVQRGYYRITDLGVEVVYSGIDFINIQFLERFPSFVEFRQKTKAEETRDNVLVSTATPEEILEESYKSLRGELVIEILQKVKEATPAFFEQLVLDVLVSMGYGGSRPEAGKRIGQSGDGGIDGLINEDRLGLDTIYVQAKRWSNTVTDSTVREFIGSLDTNGAHKGVLITTSDFTAPAIRTVERLTQKKVILLNGEALAQYMIEFNVGVSEKSTYIVKKLDHDYFNG